MIIKSSTSHDSLSFLDVYRNRLADFLLLYNKQKEEPYEVFSREKREYSSHLKKTLADLDFAFINSSEDEDYFIFLQSLCII